jgi:hypothetical protein
MCLYDDLGISEMLSKMLRSSTESTNQSSISDSLEVMHIEQEVFDDPEEDNVYQMEQLLDLEGIPPYFGNILEEAVNEPSSAIVSQHFLPL